MCVVISLSAEVIKCDRTKAKLNATRSNNIMNAATFPSPSASSASASTIMSRASEDILSQRKILKAARSPPLKTGMYTRASEDIIKQRKIVKVNKSWLGSPSPSCSSPAPCSDVHESLTAQHYVGPTQKQLFSPLSSTPDRIIHSTPPPTQTNSNDDEVHIMTRAKLFARVDSQWVSQGSGTLTHMCTSNERRVIKLVVERKVLLDVDVKQMLHMTKLLKESSKGVTAHIRFHLDADVFLIQVKPDILDTLFLTLLGTK